MPLDPRPSRAYRRFRAKPNEVEAVQWTGDNLAEIWDAFTAGNIYGPTVDWNPGTLIIDTLDGKPEGKIDAVPGDWIIRDAHGSVYPCKSDVFEATYERVEKPQIRIENVPAHTEPGAGREYLYNRADFLR